MNEAISALTSTTFAGKRFTRNQLVQIQQTVKDYRHLSLRELGHTLCEHLNWVTPGGKHRIQTCLNALEEMQTAGLFLLPEKQVRPKKTTRKPIQWSNHTAPDSAINGTLEQFTAITVERVTEPNCAISR